MLLLAALTTALAGDSLRFDLADPTPDPGEPGWWRLAWTNDRAQAARVPADLLDRLSVKVTVDLLSSSETTVYHSVYVPPGEGAPLPADQLTWRGVPAFTTIERIGDLAAWVPECRGGCPPGTYKLEVWLDRQPLTGLAADQQHPVLPLADATATIDVAVLPLLDPAATSLTVRSAVRKKEASAIELTLRNESAVAAWYPNEAARIAECDWSWTRGRQPQKLNQRNGLSGQGTWGEPEGVLVAPGQAIDFRVACDAPKLPAGLKDVSVVVRVRPAARFLPQKEAESPFWFAGELSSESAPVDVGPVD